MTTDGSQRRPRSPMSLPRIRLTATPLLTEARVRGRLLLGGALLLGQAILGPVLPGPGHARGLIVAAEPLRTVLLGTPGEAEMPLGDADATGEAKPAGEEPPGSQDVPQEYRGGATPIEAPETISDLRRAEESFFAEEWGRGLAILDEILGRWTAGATPTRRPPRKERREEKADGGAEVPGGAAKVILPFGGVAAQDSLIDDFEEPDFQPQEDVLSRTGILYHPVPDTLRSRLLDLSQEARELAARTYEAPARESYAKAVDRPLEEAIPELRRIAERYPLTRSGTDAWGALAERLLASGRPGDAARAFANRLSLLPVENGAERATTIAQLALSHLLAGAPRSGARWLAELSRAHAEDTVRVRGDAVLAGALGSHPFFRDTYRKALEAAAQQSDPTSDRFGWFVDRGTFDHAALPFAAASFPELGSQARWIFPLQDTEPPKGTAVPAGTSLKGVSLGDRVFVRRGGQIVAINAHTGKRMWIAEPEELEGGPVAAGPRYSPYGDPSGASNLGLTIFQPRDPARPSLVVGVARASSVTQDRTGRFALSPNLLLAYDAATGKLAWSLGRRESRADPLYRMAFVGPPVVASGLLVAPATRGESCHAIAITPAGKVKWTRRLYTYSGSFYARYGGFAGFGAPFAASENRVISAGGHGLVVALDAITGNVLWVSRYRSRIRQGSRGTRWNALQGAPLIAWPGSSPSVQTSEGAAGAAPADAASPGPFVQPDRNAEAAIVVAAPSDSDTITAFDLDTGTTRWERQMDGSSSILLGCDSERVYVSGTRILAIDLRTGKDVWQTEEAGTFCLEAIVLRDRIIAAGTDGTILGVDPRTGRFETRIKLMDRRLPQEAIRLFLARDEVLAATPTRIFAFKPQGESWKEISGAEGRDPFQKIRLLRAEGRFDEAIAGLDGLVATLRSKEAQTQARADLIDTTKKAAEVTGESRYLTALLSRKEPIITERQEILALRLSEARYLEAEARKAQSAEQPENSAQAAEIRARIVKAYVELATLDGVMARSPDGFEVDVGAYASDALREIAAGGFPVEDLHGEEKARARLEASAAQSGSGRSGVAGAGTRILSQIVLKRSHLPAARDALRELIERAATDAEPRAELERILLLLEDEPGEAALAARADALGAHLEEPESPTPGLAEVLARAGEAPLTRDCWIAGDEAFLAVTDPGSTPLAAMVSLSGQSVRLQDRDGNVVLSRELPDFPDVDKIKASLQSSIQEPAVVRVDGERMFLFTAAGLYCFHVEFPPRDPAGGAGPSNVGGGEAGNPARIEPGDAGVGAALGAAPGGAPVPSPNPPSPWKPRKFRLLWTSTNPHPLLELDAGSRMRFFGGGMPLPENRNFFPEVTFALRDGPVILSPDGTLVCLDVSSGKKRWSLAPESGNAVSAPRFGKPWVEVEVAGPTGLLLRRLPVPRAARTGAVATPDGRPSEATAPPGTVASGPERRKVATSRLIAGPDKGAWTACRVAGGLAAVFVGPTLEVVDVEGEKPLWRWENSGNRLAFATAGELWLSEPKGRLVARSIRSGRERLAIELPEGTVVTGVFSDPPEPFAGISPAEPERRRLGNRGRILVLSRNALLGSQVPRGQNQTGTDLIIVRLDAKGGKLWEAKAHSGGVTYTGGRWLSADGSFILLFNGEDPGGKWYTRVLRIDPGTGSFREVASAEVQGRGTGQPARLAILAGGLGLGNADGFGWFSPSARGASTEVAPGTPSEAATGKDGVPDGGAPAPPATGAAPGEAR